MKCVVPFSGINHLFSIIYLPSLAELCSFRNRSFLLPGAREMHGGGSAPNKSCELSYQASVSSALIRHDKRNSFMTTVNTALPVDHAASPLRAAQATRCGKVRH